MKLRCLICLLMLAICLCACTDKPTEQNDGTAAAVPSQSAQPSTDDNGREAANPCAAVAGDAMLAIRGHISLADSGELAFIPCESGFPVSIEDKPTGLLAGLLKQLGGEQGEIYVQMQASQTDNGFRLERLQRASPSATSIGCQEDLGGLVYLARGNEPYWGIEIREGGRIVLIRPTDDGESISETMFNTSLEDRNGKVSVFEGESSEHGSISVTITDAICIDSMTGDWFSHRAEVKYGDEDWIGCAWPGDARLEADAGTTAD